MATPSGLLFDVRGAPPRAVRGGVRPRSGRTLLVLWLSSLAALASTCSEPSPASVAAPHNTILICLDTVRADRLNCYGYTLRPTTPNLDSLAARSTLFLDASSTASWTKPSVPSFLTGTYACQHGVYEGSARDPSGEASDILPPAATTLAEVFSAHGYDTAAIVQNAQLRASTGIAQGFATYVDRAGDAASIRRQAVGWLEELDAARPFFLYLHFLDAHMPYAVPDAWAHRFARDDDERARIDRFRGDGWRELRDAINDGTTPLSPADRDALSAVYDASLAYVDAELGRLVAYLRRRGLDATTTIAVVADHGEALGEGGRIGHGHSLSETLLRVPFVLRVPERAPERVREPVSLIDLFPTVLAAAGLAAPATHQGANRLEDRSPHAAILAEHKAPDRYEQSLRRGSAKILRSFEPPPAASGSGSLALMRGLRVEIELALDPGGELRAAEIDPSDDPADDPPELKGNLDRVDATSIALGGVELQLADDLEIQSPDGSPDARPTPGALAKARLELRGGVLFATRLKLYPPGTDPDFELRGVIDAIDPADPAPRPGHLTVAGLRVRCDAETSLGASDGGTRRLDREQIAEALALGAAEAERRGWTIRTSGTALDGGTEASLPVPDAALAAELDALGARLVRARFFGAADRAPLSPAELRELQAIGYGH